MENPSEVEVERRELLVELEEYGENVEENSQREVLLEDGSTTLSNGDVVVVEEENEEEEEEIEFYGKLEKPKRKRLLSLDILRGMTVFCMIIVNNQPQEPCYKAMGHAEFDGITPTDFIFPFFLFIMGYAMGIVFSRSVRNPNEYVKKWKILKMKRKYSVEISKWIRILRRTILLFLLGVLASLISHNFDFTKVRIPGVLQRISACYFIVSLILSLLPSFYVQALTVLVLHLLYIFFMFFFPTPGCGAGVITQECSAEGYFDLKIYGKNHIYSRTKYYDPEGALSTLTSISTTYFGVLYFRISKIPKKGDTYRLITLWVIFSSVMIGLGLLLNEVVYPFNKHLWSSSFVCLTAGVGGVLLSVITFVVDVHQYQKWAQLFLWVGVNPLFMYIVPTFVAIFLMKIPVGEVSLYQWIFETFLMSWIHSTEFADVCFGVTYEFCFVPFAAFFYWRKIYIKL